MPHARKSRYDEDYRLLLKMLVDARLLARISQAEIAQKTGFGQSIISRVESGVIRLDVTDLMAYLDAVGKDLTQFMTEYAAQRAQLLRDRSVIKPPFGAE